MGDGLHGKAQMEIAGDEVADEYHHENGDEADEQVDILQHDGVPDAAHHAQAGLLGQRADDQGENQRNEEGGVLGAGAFLGKFEQGGDCQHQNQQNRHHDG